MPIPTTITANTENETDKSILLSYESDGIEAFAYTLPGYSKQLWLEVVLTNVGVAAAKPTDLIRLKNSSDSDLLDFVMRACLIAKQWRDEMATQPPEHWLGALVAQLAVTGPPYTPGATEGPSGTAFVH